MDDKNRNQTGIEEYKEHLLEEPFRVRRRDLTRTTDDMPMADPVVVKTRFGQFTTISGSLIRTPEFDERFYYSGRLGAFYTREATLFRLWAPTAQEVTVEVWDSLDESSQIQELISMHQTDVGVWEAQLAGDRHNTAYTYHLTFSDGTNHSTQDPYARAVIVNGDKSVILDPDSVHLDGFYRMPPFTHPTDAIIYEIHVRDFTIDPESGIDQKGRYLGFIEQGTVNEQGSPTGLDYLKSLGVTHVQILPMYDYATVDEHEPHSQYNWGYDPKNYNVPDGSYAADPREPANRILELKQMIKGLHEAGIRVIMDVVYNHVYEVSDHPLHKTAPGYFFRYDKNGDLSNGTGVGNDTASERRMMRKYILDSIAYWAEEFHLDGFRFDLMGIHDVQTMNEIRSLLDTIDPSIIVLGEGWNLSTELPESEKAWQGNASKMPRIAHFNDSMRDSIKGSTFRYDEKGFISGRHREGKTIAGNLMGKIDSSHYLGPDQVIQYVEAHDNLTLYDKLLLTNPEDSEETRIRRHTLATSMVILAQGIPFIHAGQEFLRTKSGVENSYRSPDHINLLHWRRQDDFRSAVEYFRGLIRLRKSQYLFRLHDAQSIRNAMEILHARGGVIAYRLKDSRQEILVIINGNDSEHRASVNKAQWEVLVRNMRVCEEAEELILTKNHVQVDPLSVLVLRRSF